MSSSSLPIGLQMNVSASRLPRLNLQAAFERSARGLYRYLAVRTGGDTHLADDLMQQLWLQALRAEPPAVDEIEPWLFGIARNLIRAHWRKQNGRPANVPVADPVIAAELARRLTTEELPSRVLERKEVRDQLLLALTELSPDDHDLIVGHYFHGRTQRALAADLGIGERAIEGRLYRARQSLRRRLESLRS